MNWLKNAGDSVTEGDPVCEVETDKAVFEVPATATGTLIETFFAADDDVPVLMNIAAIGEPGEDVSALRPDGAGGDSAAAEAAPEAAQLLVKLQLLHSTNGSQRSQRQRRRFTTCA